MRTSSCTPSKETVLGIYMLTTPKGKPIKVKSWDDARAKLVKNEIRENTAVLIGKDTSLRRPDDLQ